MERVIKKSTIMVGDSNTLLLVTEKTSRHKISKDVQELNNTTNQLKSNWHLYNLPSKKKIQYLFKSTLNLPKRDHILGHKTNLNTCKIIEIIQNDFVLIEYVPSYDHNVLYYNKRKIGEKALHTWKLGNILLINPWVKEAISRENWNIFWTKESKKHNITEFEGCS